MRLYALLASLLAAMPAAAQVPGNCELGRATHVLDVGDVRARVFNTGSLFFGYDGTNGYQAAYEVPKGSGRSPLFAASLWVGGYADGQVVAAAATYADFEFWPGPLDPATARPPNPDDCTAYDRVWRVGRDDIAEYHRTGVATPDLAEWPAHLGAPVLDGDGDSTNYDLAAGDQPAISGDQMLWWVMNDAGNAHHSTLSAPIGLEVQVSAFAFGGGPPAFHQATLYRYRFINRSGVDLRRMYVGFFADPDLGDASDDYVGSDPSRQMGFVYNADDMDGDGTAPAYGEGPPAFGFQVVHGPAGLPDEPSPTGNPPDLGARQEMAAFVAMFNSASPVPTDPRAANEFYNMLRGRNIDGSPIIAGQSGDSTRYVFFGDPVPPRFWSERCPVSATVCGTPNASGDRRFVVSTGPAPLDAGSHADVLLAMVFAQGSDHLHSIAQLRMAAGVLANAHDGGYFFEPQRVPGHIAPGLPTSIQIRRPAPNPFTDAASMSITLPAAAGVRVALVDVLGREVAVLANGPQEAGVHPIIIAGAGLAPGVYVARVWVNGQPAGALPVTRR